MANIARDLHEIERVYAYKKWMTRSVREPSVLDEKNIYEFMRSNTYKPNCYYETRFEIESRRQNYRQHRIRFDKYPD